MSAWIVNREHINYLLRAALQMRSVFGAGYMDFYWRNKTYRVDVHNASEIGKMLWVENHKSVNYRYSEDVPVPEYSYAAHDGPEVDPVVVLKQLACYDYQSCEHKGWTRSKARAFCLALRSKAINALPGYDDAPWGI